ncbi:MAG TPA: hypothetical protein VM866_01945 [Pyrinomonadaceae bacterium]|nr:hypothetical protein [Pyrinomonadaceae bacterium]
MRVQYNSRGWSPDTLMMAFEIMCGEATPAESPEKSPDGEDSNNSLEDAARDEHEYLRGRLRDELKREPSEEEMNEWLRQHTEGY